MHPVDFSPVPPPADAALASQISDGDQERAKLIVEFLRRVRKGKLSPRELRLLPPKQKHEYKIRFGKPKSIDDIRGLRIKRARQHARKKQASKSRVANSGR